MAKFIFTLIALLNFFTINAQSWQWASSTTCSILPRNELGMLSIDRVSANPGIYVVGSNLNDSICFPTVTFHYYPDSSQLIIAKYDTSGNLLWVKASESGYCAGTNATIDKEGNLLIYGRFFTPNVSIGSHTLINPNYIVGGGLIKNHCYFIMKVDPWGNIIWSRIGGNVANRYETLIMGGIGVDDARYIYVSGTFDDSTLKIEGNVYPVTHVDSGDIFLAKYDSAGVFMWAKTFGDTGCDYGQRLLIGTNNRIYLSGWYTSSMLRLGAVMLTHTGMLSSSYRPDAFLSCLDTSGAVLWAQTSTGNAKVNGLALDSRNNIFMTGSICDTAYSFGSYHFAHPNLWVGGFVTKFDSAGAVLWGKSFYPLTPTLSGSSANPIYEVTVDPCDNIWVTGATWRDSVGLDGSTLFPTTIAGPDPMIFAGFNPSGVLLDAFRLVSGGDDNAGIAADCDGSIYLAGDIRTTVALGPDTLRASGGGENMFLAKYKPGITCSGICPGDALSFSQSVSAQDVEIYPNPVAEICTVKIPFNTKTHCTATLCDVTGRLVKTQELFSTTTTVNISDLAPGLYLCRVIIGETIAITKKVTIIR